MKIADDRQPWTGERVRSRMQEAATTLRRIDTTPGPSKSVTWWPDFVCSKHEAYGYGDASVPTAQATPEQIKRMEEVLGWIARWLTTAECEANGLVEDGGWLAMARASGWSWERIGRARKVRFGVPMDQPLGLGPSRRVPGGNSRKSLMLIEKATLAFTATQLNRIDLPLDRVALTASERATDDNRRRRGGNTIAPARGWVEEQESTDV